jgi:hypothetical protein
VTEIRRLSEEQMASFGYSMSELRQIAREHGVLVPRDALHHEVVRSLAAAGVKLPPKQAALRAARRRGGSLPSYQPSSRSRRSSMPKWWAISWMTVRRT